MANDKKSARETLQLNISPETKDYITVAQTERIVKAYGVTESELEQIGYYNTFTTIYFSVFSALTILGIGIIINCLLVAQATPQSEILSKFVAPILIVLGFLSLACAIITIKTRGSAISRIKKDSKMIN